jgi:hypothetical protein
MDADISVKRVKVLCFFLSRMKFFFKKEPKNFCQLAPEAQHKYQARKGVAVHLQAGLVACAW